MSPAATTAGAMWGWATASVLGGRREGEVSSLLSWDRSDSKALRPPLCPVPGDGGAHQGHACSSEMCLPVLWGLHIPVVWEMS